MSKLKWFLLIALFCFVRIIFLLFYIYSSVMQRAEVTKEMLVDLMVVQPVVTIKQMLDIIVVVINMEVNQQVVKAEEEELQLINEEEMRVMLRVVEVVEMVLLQIENIDIDEHVKFIFLKMNIFLFFKKF